MTFWQRMRERAFVVALGTAAYVAWVGFILLLAQVSKVLPTDDGRPWSREGVIILCVLPLLAYPAALLFAWLVGGVLWVWHRVSPWWTTRHSKFLGVGALVAYAVLAVVEPRAAQSVATVIGRMIYGLVLYAVPWAVIFGIYQLHLAWQRYQSRQRIELERRVAEEVERQLQLRTVAADGSTAQPSREQSTTP